MAFPTCRATAFEQRRPLPVDAMVPHPLFTATHAITIDAAPYQVWPWIAQLGAGRAGWYSWDTIDNGGTPSARHVVPELQTVAPGDVMPAVPGATDAFVVASVDPPRDLVLTVPDGTGGNAVAWEHVLDPMPGGRTRLIVRGRASARWLDLARAEPPAGHDRIFIERAYALLAHLPRPLLIGVATFGHRVMEARHLRGIQRRSTASGHHRRSAEVWRQVLLICGILAPVLSVAMTLFVGLLWEGHSVASRVPSELSAIGAPTRPLWIWLGLLYAVLMIAFGWIVWKSAPHNRALRAAGALLVADTVFGQLPAAISTPAPAARGLNDRGRMEDEMTATSDRVFFDGYLNAWNAHDPAAVARYMADDAIYEDVALRRVLHGPAEIGAFVEEATRASSDFRFEEVSLFIAGGAYANEWIMTGTNDREVQGVPASGRSFRVRGASVGKRDASGRIVENRDYYNLAEMFAQLGLQPAALSQPA